MIYLYISIIKAPRCWARARGATGATSGSNPKALKP